ncbi:MAG: RNA recognition motif domain-containing protein [Myxococcota bacterium]
MGNKLFVGNLSFSTTEDALSASFARFGTVKEAKIIMDRETGRPRGFGFVTMGSDEEAGRAMNEMNGESLDGRPLRVNLAEDRRGPGGPRGPRSGGGGRPDFSARDSGPAPDGAGGGPPGKGRRGAPRDMGFNDMGGFDEGGGRRGRDRGRGGRGRGSRRGGGYGNDDVEFD